MDAKQTESKQPQCLPPRAGSSQKINYKVSDNMTNSKIQEAKKGLQLLKKKMSRNGMSREKNTSIEKKEEIEPPRKTMYRPQEEEQEIPEKKRPPMREEAPKRSPVPSKAQFVSQEDRPIKKTQPPPRQ